MLRGDRSFLIALGAIVLALFLNAGGSFAQNQPKVNTATSNQIPNGGNTKASPESVEAAATQVIAIYTEKLALLTGVLALVGIVTSGLALWQILLARAEFNATHRPKLRVRLVKLGMPEGGKPLTCFLTIVNVGDSDAKAIRVGFHLAIDGVAPQISMIEVSSKLASGEGKIISYSTAITCPQPWAEWVPDIGDTEPPWEDKNIRIFGTVGYADARKIRRQTGFYRFITDDPNRFRLPTDKDVERDYEYED